MRARRATHSRAPVVEPTPQGTLGELDPNAIHTSGIFVDAVVRADMDYCVLREGKLNG